MENLHWKIGDISIFQIVELEAGKLIQSTFKETTPENVKKIPWLIPHFADPVAGHVVRSGKRFVLKT